MSKTPWQDDALHVDFGEGEYVTTFADFIRNWADALAGDPGLISRLAAAMDQSGEFVEEEGLAGWLYVWADGRAHPTLRDAASA